MPKRKYADIKFSPDRRTIVDQAIARIATYSDQGYSLTLRQLYYIFVSEDLFPASWADKETGSTNNERSYKKLGDIIGDARMAGLIDWHAIEDRTRGVNGLAHWETASEIVGACASQYRLDKWVGQTHRVEVWVEKDALKGVVQKAADEEDVQYFSCRGYTSLTAIWDAGQRLKRHAGNGQRPVVLHLGDHDPSGIDMSRDIEERVAQFMDGHGTELIFQRIALNMDQVRKYRPPPNPAKVTDSRFKAYQNEHGDESWELDALKPKMLHDLIVSKIREYRDDVAFKNRQSIERTNKSELERASEQWGQINVWLDEQE